MLEFASQELSKNKKDFVFFVAGPFDDFGCPLWGVNEPQGFIYHQWSNFLRELSPELRSRFLYLGNLNSTELQRLYNATDYFVSFSTFHDEDFGMAPLESLFCGSRAILTRWGGYGSFSLDESSCKLIPVEITKSGIKLNVKKIKSQLAHLSKTSTDERVKRAQLYKSRFSITAVSELLYQYSHRPSPKLIGGTRLLSEHAQKTINYRSQSEQLYFEPSRKDKLYYSLYKNYAQIY